MPTWLSDNVGVVESAVNIGLINDKTGLCLVDTGIDNSAVNKARKSVDEEVQSAFITHHHADHMGGCSKLEKLGVSNIYAPIGELELFHNTTLEPYTMFGGATPPDSLRNRHLEATPSKSAKSTKEQTIVQPISTPGHTIDHQCFLYNDVLFSGDAAFTKETIDKYELLFAVDPASAANSIEEIKNVDFGAMVPGHGPVQHSRADAIDVLDATIDHYRSIRDIILSIIGEGIGYADYITSVIEDLKLYDIIKSRGFMQYILYQVPIQGYLSNLIDDNVVKIEPTETELTIVPT